MPCDNQLSNFLQNRRAWLQNSLVLAGAWAGLQQPLHAQPTPVLRAPTAQDPLRVVFICPGFVGEEYWKACIHVMQQAASSLHMRLEVLFGQRNPLVTVRQVQSLADRAPQERPECIIFANELSIGPELLRIMHGAHIPCMLAFSGFGEEGHRVVGYPRGPRFPLWLGSLGHDATQAGYLTAKALIDQALRTPSLHAPDGSIHMLAIQGSRSTASSVQRNAGMQKAVDEEPRVKLLQKVMADWLREKAMEQSQVLFQRYPHARVVWAGSDVMAFGAMQAWREKGGKPGVDALFSGINTSPEALAALKDGTLSALSGGHFMNGAWALVMLYDYAHGVDFASEGLEQTREMFVLLDAAMVKRFEQRFGARSPALDFSRYSKARHPEMLHYQFDIQELLKA